MQAPRLVLEKCHEEGKANQREPCACRETTPYVPRVSSLDLRMPVMDGREFSEALKLGTQEPRLRRVPVVVISGNAPSGELHDGIDYFLHKPGDTDRLIKII